LGHQGLDKDFGFVSCESLVMNLSDVVLLRHVGEEAREGG
jgi:hypothetical protein